MVNNFTDWKKSNPGKSFDDYKKLVCISEEEIQNSAPQKELKKPSKTLMVIIGTAAFIMIAYAVGYLAGDAIVRFL